MSSPAWRLNTRTRRVRRFRLRCRWRFPRASSRFLLPRDRPRRYPSRFTSRFTTECTRSTLSARRTRRGWRSSARGSPPEFRRPPPISCHSREQRLWAVSFFWLFLVIPTWAIVLTACFVYRPARDILRRHERFRVICRHTNTGAGGWLGGRGGEDGGGRLDVRGARDGWRGGSQTKVNRGYPKRGSFIFKNSRTCTGN